MNEPDTICDKCATEIYTDEANQGPPGEWENCLLCDECYAEEVTKEMPQ